MDSIARRVGMTSCVVEEMTRHLRTTKPLRATQQFRTSTKALHIPRAICTHQQMVIEIVGD